MSAIYKKLGLWLLMAGLCSPSVIHANPLEKAQALASKAQESFFAKFYKAESVRTALIRSGMAITCLTDGTCNTGDFAVLALASASLLTAFSYHATSARRYAWLPEKFNLLADSIATLASCDAGWLPITGTDLETQIRSGISCLSLLASGILFLPK